MVSTCEEEEAAAAAARTRPKKQDFPVLVIIDAGF
jgi:hypothetical protein